MKAKRILPIYIFLLVFSQISSAQQQKAEQVAEMSEYNCEILLLNLDKVFASVSNAPNSVGYVVIHPAKGSVLQALKYQSAIPNYANFRGFDVKRMKIVRGAEKDETKIEFWRVFEGDKQSSFTQTNWTSVIRQEKTALIGEQHYDYDSSCNEFRVDFFAEFLLANPHMNGKLVIYNLSISKAKKKAKELLDQLSNTQIPRDRLKIYYNTKTKKGYFYTRFWLVTRI
jgi:hypothetical protein